MAEESDNDDKTEDPSPYRLEKSREKGEVAISKELNTTIVLAACFIAFLLSTVYMFEVLGKFIDELYLIAPEKALSRQGVLHLVEITMQTILKCIFPVAIVSIIFSLLIPIMQVGFIFAPEVLEAKLERIDPMKGFSRIFSKKSVFQFLKGLLKFVVVFCISYVMLDEVTNSLIGFFHADIPTLLNYVTNTTSKIVFSILVGLFVLAIADFAFEKYEFLQKMRMTKKEVKDELKEREGNPEVRSKIKSIQREMARKRMMKEVPKADVIITNPTHISIAIKYDRSKMVAPVVVAKGADNVALRIREIAQSNQVPIVENITVARALYKEVKLGESIPRNLYLAVAEILGFVYRLKKKAKASSSEAIVKSA